MNPVWQLPAAALLLAGLGWFVFHAAPRGEAPGVTPGVLYATRLQSLDGTSVTLGQWQGKVLLLNFWAPWCAPCREEIPLLIRAQQQFGPRGVTVIGLGVDEVANIQRFVHDVPFNYPVLQGDVDASMALAARLGDSSGALPFSVAVDTTGHVLASHLGSLSQAQLQELLASALPPAADRR